MLVTHCEAIQVSRQLVIIFGDSIPSVVLEVVGQPIIKEHGPLRRKTESQPHSQGSEAGVKARLELEGEFNWFEWMNALVQSSTHNLEQTGNGEVQLAHAVLDIGVRAPEARWGSFNPSVVQLRREEQERLPLIIDGYNTNLHRVLLTLHLFKLQQYDIAYKW